MSTLNDEAVALIRRVCVDFEAAWHRGEKPEIEIWLRSSADSLQAPLRAELEKLKSKLESVDRFATDLSHDEWETLTRSIQPFSTLPLLPNSAPIADSGQSLKQKYELRELLGKGAFGAVYRAACKQRPAQFFAIKITAHADHQDSSLLEPTLLARLDHPNIVKLHDYFIESGNLILVMELIEGPNLATYMQAGRLTAPGDILELLRQIADALRHVHDQGVTHRDLKPQNILVDLSGKTPRYVLTDFGIGRILTGIQTQAQRAGTYHYMAPEQLRGRAVPQSDLWALGVIGYQLLAGNFPFPAKSLPHFVQQLYFSTPEALDDQRDPLRSELCRIVQNLLERSIAARSASAHGVVEELDRAAKLHGATQRARVATVQQQAKPNWQSTLQKTRQVATVLFALFVGLAVLLGGVLSTGLSLVGCSLFWQSQRGPKTNPLICTCGLLALFALPLLQWFDVTHQLSPVSSWTEHLLRKPGISSSSMPADSQVEQQAEREQVAALGIAGMLESVTAWICAMLAAFQLTKIRTIARQLALESDLRAPGLSAVARLNVLQEFCEANPSDLGARLGYAEALLAMGNVKSALVEGILLLEADPYHFNASLLVSEAYLRLGLRQHCIDMCDFYLRAVPYAFEFQMLRHDALRQMRRTP